MRKPTHLCIDRFNKYLLSTYCVSGAILGTGETSVKKKNRQKSESLHSTGWRNRHSAYLRVLDGGRKQL